jgi:hypothetical protein
MASPPYKIPSKSIDRFKSYWGGGTYRHTYNHTHKDRRRDRCFNKPTFMFGKWAKEGSLIVVLLRCFL